jgi:hypothetical protein
MKLKRIFSLLAGAIVLASVVYMPQASANVFALGTIKMGDFLACTFSGLEAEDLKTFDLYNGNYTIVDIYPTTGYANSITDKFFITGCILSNYTYSVAVKGVLNSPVNDANHSQSLSTASIPEPGEWAMIFLGVGLAGYQIRRKQKLLNHSSVG